MLSPWSGLLHPIYLAWDTLLLTGSKMTWLSKSQLIWKIISDNSFPYKICTISFMSAFYAERNGLEYVMEYFITSMLLSASWG